MFQMSPMSSQFMPHSSMYMGNMSSMSSMSSMAAAGQLQQPHSAFGLGSNTPAAATNAIGNSMVRCTNVQLSIDNEALIQNEFID